jgi:hypothetical protein
MDAHAVDIDVVFDRLSLGHETSGDRAMECRELRAMGGASQAKGFVRQQWLDCSLS